MNRKPVSEIHNTTIDKLRCFVLLEGDKSVADLGEGSGGPDLPYFG